MADMQLPFTREEFHSLFAAYNSALWPAAGVLWLASVLAAVSLLASRHPRDRWISGLLTVHWAWSAIAYHLVFFTRINPAAWLFAALFLVQAALFFWLGFIRHQPSFQPRRTPWTPVGWLFVAYGLLYPAINAVQHGSLLTVPTFGLPCPTTIFTAGLLMMGLSRPRTLAIVPIIWSAIGGSAAFLLGVTTDYALLLAGATLALFTWQQSETSSAAAPSLHSQGSG